MPSDIKRQPKDTVAQRYLQGLAVLSLCLTCTSSSILLAQSGRNQTQPQAEIAPPKSPQAGMDDQKDLGPSPAFIVVTSIPNRSRHIGAYWGYSQLPNLEYHARGGCLLELKRLPGAKVAEDEDVARWEARETALAEDRAWVIWMELRWDKTPTTYDSTPFRLRYLLFEPRTGRIASSGVGKGIRQTWGMQPGSNSLEDQLREAGRDIASQVLSEIRKGK